MLDLRSSILDIYRHLQVQLEENLSACHSCRVRLAYRYMLLAVLLEALLQSSSDF